MPKLKSHSGAKKRFNLTKTGKVKRAQAFMDNFFGIQTQVAIRLKIDPKHGLIEFAESRFNHQHLMIDMAEQLRYAVVR